MAQSPAIGGSVQQTLQQNVHEPVPLKRKKKDSGAPVGKSVVVLKSSNVTIRDDFVFMPNTIEMAQLKKKEKGQFLTNVQISSEMTQQDISELLISSFPYLGDQRFYCASAVDNRTRLDFHGERRIWDGRLIKQRIKGNSALYIYTDEGSLGKQDSTSSKQSTLKRPHDQMTQTMQSECRIDKDGTTQNIVSTASQSQSRKPAMHVADGQAEGRNTIPSKSSLLPHSDLQDMASSSLTPQLNSLSIASAASEQERGQLGHTADGGYDLADVPLQAKTSWQGQGNGAATGVQDITCNSTDQSKLGSVVSAEVQCAGKRGSVSYATDAHMEDAGTSGSDFEPQSSDSAVERPSDSGIEGSDNLFVDDRVKDIRPDSCSVKGRVGFYIALNEALPDEVKKGKANFEGVATVTVDKENSLLLSGTIPPSQKAGEVMVTVTSDSDQYIGYTWFKYTEEEFAVDELLKRLVKDRTLQSKYFAMLSQELKEESPESDSKKPEALGQLNVPHLGSSVETKQKQSVELLQLMVYTAAQTNAQRFIETVFSTSAGQVVFNYYKDRTPLPEDVARANGYDKLAQYLQDLHTRLCLDKNVLSTVIDWLELVEAVQKQSLTTQDESPVGLDQSDEDDDNSSDYFADAETSSCGSSDDDTGWPEISENKEPCIHDEISNEVQSIGECDDLPMTRSSKASFTKNERIIKGESTMGQTTRNDICVVVKQGSSCLDKGRESGEYSELPSSPSCVADFLEMSCEDQNNENSISKGPCIHGEISNEVQSIGACDDDDLSWTCFSKASFTKNERIIIKEPTKGQIMRDEISFVVKQGFSCLDKGEERETSELSKPERITSLPALFVMSCEDPGEDSLIIRTSRNNMAKQPKGTAFSTINTLTALHETEESPAKRNHRKRGAYKEGPIVGPWFELGWFHLAIVLILVLPTIIVVILIFPGTTMLSAETSTTNSPSQYRRNCASCNPCPPSYGVKNTCAEIQETDCRECWLGYDYSNTTVSKCCMARSGSADGIYNELSAHDRLCTRQWSTKILSVQSAAVLTVNTSSGTCPYEKKESPGEPSLSQKDASYKKPIQQLSGFFLGVLAALVTTVVAVQWYKKRKRLYQSNDNDAQQSESNNRATTEQQSIPELQHTSIRDLLASRLDDKDPDGDLSTVWTDLASRLDVKDPDGFYNWKKLADALGLERDELRVNPTDKLNLLSAFAERKDSTIRKLIEASQEAGLPLLASELDKRFLKGS